MPGSPQCIVGLGNPGRQYRSTRHNVGTSVLRLLADSFRREFTEGSGEFVYAEQAVGGQRFLLAVPTTYMNDSGFAVAQLCAQFGVSPSGLTVVYDDFQLPLGTLRFRTDGSDGGHNGMASVIEHLQSMNVPRLRVGIAGATCPSEDRKDLMASYVLSRFDEDEKELSEMMMTHARDALIAFMEHGIQFAMNHFNRSFLGPEQLTDEPPLSGGPA